jgi:hypothetical protein
VEDFEDFDPDVLILALDTVEKAKGYALDFIDSASG